LDYSFKEFLSTLAKTKNMLIIGHRGAAGFEPENTIASFKKAIELGVEMIEFDVQLCKSGELVIIHDYSLDRTTNGKGPVIEKTITELKNLDAGKGQKIPTLSETLQFIDGKTKVNIELKGKTNSEQVAEVIEHFIKKGNWKMPDFIVSSFNHSELLKFHKLMPGIRIGVLYEAVSKDFDKTASALNAFSINADFDSLTKEITEDIHSKKYRVYAYTVNSASDKQRMKTLGVDGIFTDFPESN
jgi:glycerophosphoryl diester phosphodiesterase